MTDAKKRKLHSAEFRAKAGLEASRSRTRATDPVETRSHGHSHQPCTFKYHKKKTVVDLNSKKFFTPAIAEKIYDLKTHRSIKLILNKPFGAVETAQGCRCPLFGFVFLLQNLILK